MSRFVVYLSLSVPVLVSPTHAFHVALPANNTALPQSPPQQSSPGAPQSTPAKTVDSAPEPADDFATLDTIVVSADGGVPLTYPGGRDVVEPETLDSYPGQNVDSILRRTPSVYFLPENGNDSRINVGLRGNDPRRSALTTLMVDGIPVCEAPYGNTDVDGLPIALQRVWRVDVIRGGASIRYGPNSAGGIVNFITEPVPDRPMLRLGGQYGSDEEYAASIATGGTWDRFGVLVTGVVKGGDGFRDNSDYQDWDGSVKARYALSESETFSAYISRFTEFDAEQPGGLSQADYDADPDQSTRPGANFNFDMDRYVLGYSSEIDATTRFEIKGWYQEGFRQLNDFRPIDPPFTVTRQQNSDFYAGAVEASYAWETEWLGVEHAFYHSARALEEKNDEFYVRTPIAGGPPNTPYELNADFKGQAVSLFTEDVIAVAENVKWGIGLRTESIVMTGSSNDTNDDVVQDYGLLLPETNVTWTVASETALYASYQEGFYPPQYETGFDPASVLYAPTSPEHSDAYEVGVRSRDVKGLDATVALFDTEYTDKIDFITNPDGTKTPVNTGHARARGIEVAGNYDVGTAMHALRGLSAYGSVTSQRSTIESGVNDGNDTPNSPHLVASWGSLYDHEPTGLWARIGGSYSDESFKDLANTETGSANGVNGLQPAYTLWDCAIGWNQNPDHSGFSLAFGITNLFDEDYFRRFVSGIYPGAPRQSYVAVSYEISF